MNVLQQLQLVKRQRSEQIVKLRESLKYEFFKVGTQDVLKMGEEFEFGTSRPVKPGMEIGLGVGRNGSLYGIAVIVSVEPGGFCIAKRVF